MAVNPITGLPLHRSPYAPRSSGPVGGAVRRVAPKPKRKKKPKVAQRPVAPQGVSRTTRKKAARAQTPEARRSRAVTGATREVGRTARDIGRSLKYAQGPRGMGTAFDLDKLLGELESPAEQVTGVRTAGFDPNFLRGGSDGNWLRGLLQNAGSEAVGMAMGVPSAIQLAGQGLAYLPVAGVDAVTPDNSLVGGIARNTREGIEENYQQAARAIIDDYKYRYGPLFEGNFGEFGSRVYDQPLSFGLDAAAGYGAAGRTPSLVARGTARVAPDGSPLQARAVRYNSILAPGESVGPGMASPSNATRAGNRYRPDKVYTGRAQGEDRQGGGVQETREIRVPQRPYSSNAITRGVQKAATRGGRRVARRVEEVTQGTRGVEGVRTRGMARVGNVAARQFSEQAKFNRAERRQVREMVLRRNQEEAAVLAPQINAYNRSIKRLKRDRNEAGIEVGGLSSEALATRLHLEGVLSPRAGMSASQLRDLAVKRMRDGINRRRNNGERLDAEALQVERIAALPDELLDLSLTGPRTARVREAVEAGRRLDRDAQRLEVKSKVVSRESARERSSLASRVLLGGAQDALDLYRAVRDTGDKAGAARVKFDATSTDPRVSSLRAQLADAEAKLADVKSGVDTAPARRKVRDLRAQIREAEANQRWRVAGARKTVDKKKAAVEKERRRLRNARREAAAQEKLKAENRRKAAAPAVREPSVKQAFKTGEKAGAAKARREAAEKREKKSDAKRPVVKRVEDRTAKIESAVEKLEERVKPLRDRMAREARDSAKAGAKFVRNRNATAGRMRYQQKKDGNRDTGNNPFNPMVRKVTDEASRTRGKTGAFRDKNLTEFFEELVRDMRLHKKNGGKLTPEENALLRDLDVIANLRSQVAEARKAIDDATGANDPFGVLTAAEKKSALDDLARIEKRSDAVLEMLARASMLGKVKGSARFGQLEAEARAAFASLREAEKAAKAARDKYTSAVAQAARTKAKPITNKRDAELAAPLRAAEAELQAALREVDRIRGEKPNALKNAYENARVELANLRGVTKGTADQISTATRRRDEIANKTRNAEEAALKNALTPAQIPQLVGHDGVYIPHVRRSVHSIGQVFRTGTRGTSGPAKPKRSKGRLIADGIVDWNPALLSHQARRASSNAVGTTSREALAELIDIAAFTAKNKDGKLVPIAGQRAVRLAQTDPSQVALVNVGALRNALKELDDADFGETLGNATIDAAVISGRDKVLAIKGPQNGYIAISRAAADEWRGVMTDPAIGLKMWDTVNDYWKGAILALSPRWYMNSTLGAGFQYGLLTGFDIRAIRRANRKGAIRDAVPTREALNTLAEDVGFKGRIDANRLQRAMTKGFEINNRIEAGWRRAAFLNRAEKSLRREGVRTRGMSDMEVAHAISNMPPSLARQVTRDIDLFMGEFRKFSPFEQNVLRRVLPFYSWLRVITKLTVSLPFRSPARLEALMVAAKMGTAAINPDDYKRPWYDRGSFVIPGTNLRMRTSGWNSLATLVPFAEAIGAVSTGQGGGVTPLVKELGAWTTPMISTLANVYAGNNTFGSDVFAPGPRGGSKVVNPVTGGVFISDKGLPIFEAILQAAIPGQAGPLRRALAGGESVYDTTSTLDLLMYRITGRGDPDKMFYRKGTKVNEKVGPGGIASAASGFFGTPIQRENPRERDKRYRKDQREAERAARKREREG